MWAAIPILRTLSRGMVRATATSFVWCQPFLQVAIYLQLYTFFKSFGMGKPGSAKDPLKPQKQ
jgi:hypothetical protein